MREEWQKQKNGMENLNIPETTVLMDSRASAIHKEAVAKAKQDAEDVTKPLILDFYTWHTDLKATLAQIAERIEKQFPQGFTGCFKVTIERN